MNSNFLNFILFLLPITFIGNNRIFIILRSVLLVLLFYNYLKSFRSINPTLLFNKRTILFLLFPISDIIFMYVKEAINTYYICYVGMEFLIILLTLSLVYTNNEKKDPLKSLVFGCGLAGILGYLYMFITGIYVTGGSYVENDWNISNLTVPLFIGVYVVYDIIMNIPYWDTNKKKVLMHLFISLALFSIILVLDKRGPLFFSIISILIVSLSINYKIKKILMIIIFLFPIYELSITEFISNNADIFQQFSRFDDFEDVEDNPRIYRLFAAGEFVSDFEMQDFWGYHKELVVSKDDNDEAHNHFHNFLLQLYYEKGLFGSLIVLFCIIRINIKNKENKDVEAIIFFLLLIGTNESVLRVGSISSMMFLFVLTYNCLRTRANNSLR